MIHLRLLHSLAQQFRRPSGFLATPVGFLFRRMNREAVEWTIALLDIKLTDRVLEIGFGPGLGIQQAAALALRGHVAGVDFSDAMVRQARTRNAAAIAAGRAELRHADAAALPYPDRSFDKVFAVNVIYFWPEPVTILRELRRVLKPGGRLALYLIAKEDLAKYKLTRTGLYRHYTGEDVARLLTEAGFSGARFETRQEKHRTGIGALAETEGGTCS